MEEKVDLRIQRTRTALMGALRELLCEQSFEEVTVAELCRRAQVRRATFYKHFGDKNELLAFMIREQQREFSDRSEGGDADQAPGVYCAQAFCHLLDFLEENKKMVRTVLQSPARYAVLNILQEEIEQDLRVYFRGAKTRGAQLAGPVGMMAALYSGAAVNCAIWWVDGGAKAPKEELTACFSSMMGRLDGAEQ